MKKGGKNRMHSSKVNVNNVQCRKNRILLVLVSEKTQKARNKQNMYSYKRCSQYSRDPTGIATPKPSITSRAIFTVTTLSLFTQVCFPCGLDIGMLCGQSDYPNPSLGSHGVSGIQTFFQLVGRFYQNTQPAAK